MCKNRLENTQKMEFRCPGLMPAVEALRGVPAGSKAVFWLQGDPEMSTDIEVDHFRALVGEIRGREQKIEV